jgi:hypothetical protein
MNHESSTNTLASRCSLKNYEPRVLISASDLSSDAL